MNRLHTELQRLYAATPIATDAAADTSGPLLSAQGLVRALVLELARPADWAVLSRVWQGVQAELDWPAPAIAVSGRDGLQLWFSLAQAVPAEQAQRVLMALRERFLPDVRAERLAVWPRLDEPGSTPLQAAPVPAAQQADGPWSAYVAPDLAPMFADEPWLDLPPNPDGQAELLARLKSIGPRELLEALPQRPPLAPSPAAVPAASHAELAGGSAVPTPAVAAATQQASRLDLLGAGPWPDPQAFLLAVMNHPQVDLGLRVEAAKALLPHLAPPSRG